MQHERAFLTLPTTYSPGVTSITRESILNLNTSHYGVILEKIPTPKISRLFPFKLCGHQTIWPSPKDERSIKWAKHAGCAPWECINRSAAEHPRFEKMMLAPTVLSPI